MVIGNGVDIIDIERIRKIITKNPRFLERNFTTDELALFKVKKMHPATIAAGFAAKEAVSKAMGTGIRGFNLIDIEVLRDSLGKPIVKLHGNAKEVATSKGIDTFELSLSHTDETAIAFVISLAKRTL
jgi:holo-[acyl-carrier protein] synthase